MLKETQEKRNDDGRIQWGEERPQEQEAIFKQLTSLQGGGFQGTRATIAVTARDKCKEKEISAPSLEKKIGQVERSLVGDGREKKKVVEGIHRSRECKERGQNLAVKKKELMKDMQIIRGGGADDKNPKKKKKHEMSEKDKGGKCWEAHPKKTPSPVPVISSVWKDRVRRDRGKKKKLAHCQPCWICQDFY